MNIGVKESQPNLQGMGAICTADGVGFRVWAPGADKVLVLGDFQDWKQETALPLTHEGEGYWYGFSSKAQVGDEYKYQIERGEQKLLRIDPYARQLTHSDGNGVIYDPAAFDWSGDDYRLPPLTDIVIYELHLGTFAGTFEEAIGKLRYLQALGINVIELMPVTDFPGERSWGYNPAHCFSVETNYGGSDGLKSFVKAAHEMGIGVVLDVVYNHLGPDDLDLWNFDGSAEDGSGGIYFYPDERAATPWGDTRPNYASDPVRRFLRDNLMMWFEEYRMDGIRTDGTVYIRRQEHDSPENFPEGWSLLQWFNEEAASLDPPRLKIAEDLQNDEWLTKPVAEGGAGFWCQWDSNFCSPIRQMLASTEDHDRLPSRLAEIFQDCYNGDPFQSVIYVENHDEVARDARMVSEVDPENPQAWHAKARALLGIAIVLTAPGVPMLFQGHLRLQEGQFNDGEPLDWSTEGRDRTALRIGRDFIHLRSGRDDRAPGLRSSELEVLVADDEKGMLLIGRAETKVLFNLRHQALHWPLPKEPEVLAATGPWNWENEVFVLGAYGAVIFRD